jgi:hypothetical protein
MYKECSVVLTRRKTSSLNHGTESFKPSTRSLFEPIKSLSKAANMTQWNLNTWRWMHVHFLM